MSQLLSLSSPVNIFSSSLSILEVIQACLSRLNLHIYFTTKHMYDMIILEWRCKINAIIINGKTIKSKNAYYNKEIARLASIRMKQLGSEKFNNTKQIRNLRLKRKNFVKDYLHKASRKIINIAIRNKVSTIVIGDIREIKHGSKIKSFVQIQIQKLIVLIE